MMRKQEMEMKWYIKFVIILSVLGTISSIMSIIFEGFNCVNLSLLILLVVNGIGAYSKYREEFCGCAENDDIEYREFEYEQDTTRSTGCFDVSGDEIFFGDRLFIKSKLTNMEIITRNAEERTDGISGFQVKYGQGYLRWDKDDHDACYEVMKVANTFNRRGNLDD